MNLARSNQPRPSKATPIVSLHLQDGTLIETLFRPREGRTRLVSSIGGQHEEHERLSIEGREYVPYSADNNLLTHRVVRLPSAVGASEPDEQVLDDIRTFIHRYVDLSPAFEEVAAHYVLLTWVYDAFNELPYLRVRGQYGSGKSRFLLAIGSISYKPIFASGASTISPIFRLIDQVGGTLVIDEADFWASDERSEIVKILNNGNARGFPVLRNDITPQKEFNPRAFNIFGPKIVGTRHQFEDAALESRCLTEILGGGPIRPDIPISLPRAFEGEAEVLRNRLLAYRFRTVGRLAETALEPISGMMPRRAQILAPLLAVATSADSRTRLKAFSESKPDTLRDGRSEVEKCVLFSLKAMLASSTPLTIAGIAAQFKADWSGKYGVEISHRWLGAVIRRLGLCSQKSNGIYVIPQSEYPHLVQLLNEHGLGDVRDVGDVPEPLPGYRPNVEPSGPRPS